MKKSLDGIRVACFYPWGPHIPCGAWTRFTSHWRFLLEEGGAQVTLAFIDKGQDVDLLGLNLRHLGESLGPDTRASILSWLEARPEVMKTWPLPAVDLLIRYQSKFYLESPRVTPWLTELVQQHDVVTCEYPMFLPLLAPFCQKYGRPLILTVHDMLFELHGSTEQEKKLLKHHELEAMRLADVRFFCNDDERHFFEKQGLSGVTVRSTSDVCKVILGGESNCQIDVVKELKLASAKYCLFVGSDHEPNRRAATEIRKLAKMTPELTFVVVGKCCDPVADGNFVALGQKPEPLMDQLLRGAFTVIVPLLRGTGVSVKLFQALSYGKAIVATPVGARGYNVRHEHELLIAPQVANFPAVLRRLAADEALRLRLGKSARAFAEQLDFRLEFRPYAHKILEVLNRPAASAATSGPGPALILVDNNLKDRIGHHLNYALSIKEQCHKAGIEFTALIKRTAAEDVVEELKAQAIFTQGIQEESPTNPYPASWGPLRASYDFLMSNDYFYRELETGLAQSARPGDLVFLPNATPRQMLGVALLLLKNPIYLKLNFIVMLRYSVIIPSGPFSNRKPLLDKELAQKYSMGLELLHKVDSDGMVRFVTDSQGLANEFEQISHGRAIQVLPIPHTLLRPSADSTALVPTKDPQRLRLIYLGDAREEKGFELLPLLVRECLKVNLAVEFVFHAYVSSLYHHTMNAVIEELDRLKLPQLHLVRRSLDHEDYYAMLHSADLVLLPYDAVTYRSRASGPFIEAICADKPVVVPANSWMSEQLKGVNAGTIFNSGNGLDFSRAVKDAVDNIEAHQKSAKELGEAFRVFHNPKNFVEKLRHIQTVQ